MKTEHVSFTFSILPDGRMKMTITFLDGHSMGEIVFDSSEWLELKAAGDRELAVSRIIKGFTDADPHLKRHLEQ